MLRKSTLDDLMPLAESIAARLKTRHESIAIAESSTGGLIAAALLALPGASAYFLGGAVAYTRQAKGATGPTGNRYGDPPGHTCLAVAGMVERASTLETGAAERLANMHAFARAALELLAETIPKRQ